MKSVLDTHNWNCIPFISHLHSNRFPHHLVRITLTLVPLETREAMNLFWWDSWLSILPARFTCWSTSSHRSRKILLQVWMLESKLDLEHTVHSLMFEFLSWLSFFRLWYLLHWSYITLDMYQFPYSSQDSFSPIHSSWNLNSNVKPQVNYLKPKDQIEITLCAFYFIPITLV